MLSWCEFGLDPFFAWVGLVESTPTEKLFARNFHKKFCVESAKKYAYVPPLEHIPPPSTEENEALEKKDENEEWQASDDAVPSTENVENDVEEDEEEISNMALKMHNALFAFGNYDLERMLHVSCEWMEEIITSTFGDNIDVPLHLHELYKCVQHSNTVMELCMQKYLGIALELMDEQKPFILIEGFKTGANAMVEEFISAADDPKKNRASFMWSAAQFRKKDPSILQNWEEFLYDNDTQAKIISEIPEILGKLRKDPYAECIPLSVFCTVLYCAAHALGSGILPPINAKPVIRNNSAFKLKLKDGETSKDGCTNRIQWTLEHEWCLKGDALEFYKIKDSRASNIMTGAAGNNNFDINFQFEAMETMQQEDICVNSLVWNICGELLRLNVCVCVCLLIGKFF